jgi:hypothetical protein
VIVMFAASVEFSSVFQFCCSVGRVVLVSYFVAQGLVSVGGFACLVVRILRSYFSCLWGSGCEESER